MSMSKYTMLASIYVISGSSILTSSPFSSAIWVNSYISRLRFITLICYRLIDNFIKGTVALSMKSICPMNPDDFNFTSSLYRRRISRTWLTLSPPIFKPVTAKSTSLESTARKLAWDPYYLSPTGTIIDPYFALILL